MGYFLFFHSPGKIYSIRFVNVRAFVNSGRISHVNVVHICHNIKKMSTIFPSWLLCLSISLSTIFGCFVCRIRLYELHEWKHAIQFDVIVYVNRNGKRVIQHMHKHISRQRVDYDDGRNNDDDDNIKRGENINMNISISFSRLFKIFLLEKSHSHYRFHLDDWP